VEAIRLDVRAGGGSAEVSQGQAISGPHSRAFPLEQGGSRVCASRTEGLGTADRWLSVYPSGSSFILGCVRLSEWAKQEGIHYQTAWKWFKDGALPVPARQTATGTILIDAPAPAGVLGVGLYARVSSLDQREDLERQVGRLAAWATEQGVAATVTVAEVGSGLNGSRTRLRRLLADPTVGTVVVEHRERLARFGVEYIEAALRAQGRRLVVVEERELDDDLVRDITEVLTSMCARLYGRRSAKRRAEAALAAAGNVA